MRIFLCLLLAASTVQAGTSPAKPANTAPTDSLPPETLEAIHRISQNVLQAKTMGRQQADSHYDQLMLLNTAISKLIAIETQSFGLTARMAADTQAWDVIGSLRQDADQLQTHNNAPAQVQMYSGGLPVGEQQGRLFEKWADELEEIVNNHAGNHLAQLKALQARLTIQKGDMTPPIPKTPTIQARSWIDPVAPVTNNSNNKTARH